MSPLSEVYIRGISLKILASTPYVQTYLGCNLSPNFLRDIICQIISPDFNQCLSVSQQVSPHFCPCQMQYLLVEEL
ncbi:hypothetical protein LguiA_029855 [Lonicera macranthoides]